MVVKVARSAGRIAFVATMLGLVVGLGGYLWLATGFDRAGSLAEDRVVVIGKGAGLAAISRTLAEADVLDNPLVFRLGVRLFGGAKPLRAGEFRFAPRMTPRQVMEHIASGPFVMHAVTIAEGLTTQQAVAEVMAAEALDGMPEKSYDEGALLPETYHFARGESRQAVLERMRAAMDKTLDDLWGGRDPGLPLANKAEALILASIVEKETGVSSERARVAAVFVNRLREGMRLQSDPTVIYGVTGGDGSLGRPIRRSELDGETPYNTYVIPGLPPGPICNPGRAAIEAVLHPAKSDELYFVADGTGGHVFAKTLEDHNKNVSQWRKMEKARQ